MHLAGYALVRAGIAEFLAIGERFTRIDVQVDDWWQRIILSADLQLMAGIEFLDSLPVAHRIAEDLA
ncbi:MAG: hypothetical protein R3E12_00035, partial [Candidatus Eisenbacteria bacterium]